MVCKLNTSPKNIIQLLNNILILPEEKYQK